MTIGLLLMFLKCPFAELCNAECAHEMLRMEFVPHCGDTSPSDGLVTCSTQRPSVLVVMYLTVGSALMLVIRTSTKPILTLKAYEALNMPLFLQRCNTVIDDGLATRATLRGKLLVIVLAAVRFTFKYMVLCASKRTVAVHTHKMLRMPGLLHCCCTFI